MNWIGRFGGPFLFQRLVQKLLLDCDDVFWPDSPMDCYGLKLVKIGDVVSQVNFLLDSKALSMRGVSDSKVRKLIWDKTSPSRIRWLVWENGNIDVRLIRGGL